MTFPIFKFPSSIAILTIAAAGVARAEITAGRNLLVNGSATSAVTSGWTVTANGGSGWSTGGNGYDQDGGKFITSYAQCTRSQTIDLLATGATAAELDAAPPLRVSEAISMYNGNGNNDTYYIKVELRNAAGAAVASWNVGTSAAMKAATTSWVVESHEFRDYGPGVRSIYFEDGGMDGGFWAGNYGTYHDAATVAFTNMPVTDISATPPSFPVNVPAGGIAAQLRATDADDHVHTFALEAEVTSATENLLNAAEAGWRYYDSATPPPADWASASFFDGLWSTGAAPLGYDSTSPIADTWLVTQVSYGPNAATKPLTAWFRKTFTVNDPAVFTGLAATLMIDDGCVAYLNGQELFRDGMAAGPVTDTTAANRGVSGSDESDYDPVTIPVEKVALLVPGTNVLAIETHQDRITSSDLSVDMTLSATRTAAENRYSNDLFEIHGTELRLKDGSAGLAPGNYIVRVKATDPAGNSFIKLVTVTRGDAVSTSPPTGLTLTAVPLAENAKAGTPAGTLTAVDADPGDAHGYSLVAGPGDDDNARVTIADNRLLVAQPPDYEQRSALLVRVMVTDSAGATFTEAFSIAVTDNTAEDQDGDGLTEADEDTNNNGVLDPGETDPLLADSDGDTYSDRVERNAGSDPRDPGSIPSVLELRQTLTHATGESWLTETSWEGGVAPTAANITVTDNLTLRPPPTADPVFPGEAADLRNGAVFRLKHTGLASVPRIILRNAMIQHGMTEKISLGGPDARVEVPVTGTIDTAGYELELQAALSGPGVVKVIGTAGGILRLQSPSPAFTGELSLETPETILGDPVSAGAARRIVMKSGVLRAEADTALPQTVLQRSGTGQLSLARQITVAEFVVDGRIIPPGVYTGAELLALNVPAAALADSGGSLIISGGLQNQDSDSDGASDLLEILASTGVLDAASRPGLSGVARPAPGTFRLTWTAVAGVTYTVQSATTLEGPWTDAGTVTPTGTAGTFDVVLPAPVPARAYFRLALK